MSHRTPSGLVNLGTGNTHMGKPHGLGFQIVTHQVELELPALSSGMNRHLGRGQRKNQPSVAAIDRREPKHVPQESPIGICIFRINDDMRAKEHEISPFRAPKHETAGA